MGVAVIFVCMMVCQKFKCYFDFEVVNLQNVKIQALLQHVCVAQRSFCNLF